MHTRFKLLHYIADRQRGLMKLPVTGVLFSH